MGNQLCAESKDVFSHTLSLSVRTQVITVEKRSQFNTYRSESAPFPPSLGTSCA